MKKLILVLSCLCLSTNIVCMTFIEEAKKVMIEWLRPKPEARKEELPYIAPAPRYKTLLEDPKLGPWCKAHIDECFLRAFKKEDHTAIDYTLKRGANINATDFENKTALIIAAERNQPVYALRLLALKADIFAKDDKGHTALLYAAQHARPTNKKMTEFIKELIAKGANINQQDRKGNTVLIYAAQKGNADLFAFLLAQKGIDSTLKNNALCTVDFFVKDKPELQTLLNQFKAQKKQ